MDLGGDDDAADDRPTFPDDPSGQHGPLAEQIERLLACVSDKVAAPGPAELLDGLISDFGHHFEAEERAMERGEYPLLDDHRDSHAKFMSHLVSLRRELGEGGTGLSRAVIEQLQNWFQDHTQTADADAMKFLGYAR